MPKSTLLLMCIVALPTAWAQAGEPVIIQPERVLQLVDGVQANPAVVTGLSLSPGGGLIAAAGDDHVIRVWSNATGELTKRLGGHGDWVRCVAFSPNGNTVASAGDDRQTRLWDLARGEVSVTFDPHEQAISSITYSPAGDLLAVVGFDPSLKLYDTATGKLRRELEGSSDDQRAVLFSPDGHLLASAGRDGRVRIWEVESGKLVADFAAHRRRVRALAWSPNSKLLASAGECRQIAIWDLEQPSNTPTRVTGIPSPTSKILSLVFTSDHQLATGGSNNEVLLWDIATQTVAFRLEGHTGSVAALAFDQESGLLASGSFDTTIRIWNLKRLGHDATALREGEASSSQR